MRAWLIVLIGFAAPAAADPLAAREALSRCMEVADDPSDTISQGGCPELAGALEELQFTELLPASKRESFTSGELVDLLRLHERYAAEAARSAPNVADVNKILERLTDAPARAPSLWQRFKDWLRQFVQPESGELPPWLIQVLEKLPDFENALTVFAYVAIAAFVVFAIVIVIVELRAAGIFKRHGKAADSTSSPTWKSEEATLALGALDAAPLLDRPALLLKLLTQVLIRHGHLRVESSLTHRELVRAVGFKESTHTVRFEAVALLAERIRYARRGASSDEDASRVVDAGKELLAELESAGAGRSA